MGRFTTKGYSWEGSLQRGTLGKVHYKGALLGRFTIKGHSWEGSL